MPPLKPSQFRLRTILIAAAILPPAIGAIVGVFGPEVQFAVCLLLALPLAAIGLLAYAFVFCAVALTGPILMFEALDFFMDRRRKHPSRRA
jgi:hypothetical protein